ncbi:MAG: sulfatase-like hydrolase/transferase [Verrucomicrobia bacterium]|nr:sulfatase-like hydrolase/transferase [Verrucomicrobiota bacterium]
MILRLSVILFAILTSVGAAPDRRPPNILLIVSDDQPPDTIRALGNTYIDTPNLDRLVNEGASFVRAITGNPVCIPSRAEIMTGATGFRNGSPPFGKAIDPEMALWAETMRKAAYHAWYSGKWMNDGTPKTRGYEETRGLYSGGGGGGPGKITYPTAYHGRPSTGYGSWTFKTNDGKPEVEKGVGLTPITDRHIADGALEFINRRPDKPFFLHVNFTAPHFPLHFPPGYEKKYDPAAIPLPRNFLPEHPFDHGNTVGGDEQLLPLPRDPAEVKANIAASYALISHMDEQVGRLLQALRETNQHSKTVVIFTSDHGMANGSHGLMGKQNMYEHTIGVPLIMAGPGIPRNQRFAAQIYLRDLYPTVCELAGIPIPATVEGRSVVPVLAGLAREIYPEVYAYWHKPTKNAELPIQRMVRTERWKLIYYSHLNRYQLFDLASDPHELKDLSSHPDYGGLRAGLRRKTNEWFAPRIKPYSNSLSR